MAQRSDKQMSIGPTISRLLDSNVGNILKSGGRVKGSELSIADQQALGIRPDQNVKLSRQILAQLQDAVNTAPVSPVMPRIDRVTGQPITPIANLNQVVNPSVAIKPAMKETPVEEGSIVSGGIDELLQRIRNTLVDPITKLPLVRIPFDIAAGKKSDLGQGFQGEGVSTIEPIVRLLSDLTKKTKQIIPSQTLEQRALKELSTKQPELAKGKDEKGLKKFAGTGEFRVNGTRYKVDNTGRIIKIG